MQIQEPNGEFQTLKTKYPSRLEQSSHRISALESENHSLRNNVQGLTDTCSALLGRVEYLERRVQELQEQMPIGDLK